MTVQTLLQKLKKYKHLKNRLNFFPDFFLRFLRRSPGYYFYSHKIAYSKSLNKNNEIDVLEGKLLEIYQNKVEGLSFFQHVLSFPLGDGKVESHSGGLADGKTYQLIPEAIHYNTSFCQEPPDFDLSALPGAKLPQVKQLVLFGGILYNNFGHFLLESLGRLWAYEQVRELDPFILFYAYWGKPNYLDNNNFVNQVFRGLNIPLNRILFIDDLVNITHIIIPEQKYGYEFCRKPDNIFMGFINTFQFPAKTSIELAGKEKLYVSRARLPTSLGKLIGEVFFEDFLRSCGYTIFYPEKYTLYEQLTAYSNARRLIFADGSALHACILLPGLRAEVAIISRRKDTKWIPKDITDQFTGYGKEVLWIDAVKEQYQFGLETWNAISTIDWFLVSQSLQVHGFVDTLFERFHEIEYPKQVKKELHKYILNIRKHPKFINFMMKMNEPEVETEKEPVG